MPSGSTEIISAEQGITNIRSVKKIAFSIFSDSYKMRTDTAIVIRIVKTMHPDISFLSLLSNLL